MTQFKLKPGLRWSRIETRSGNAWVVSDPVTSSIVRLSNEERELLLLVDRTNSIATALQQFSTQNPHLDYSESDLRRLIQLFQSQSMVISPRQFGSPQPATDLVAVVMAAPWKLMFARISLFNPNRFVTSVALKFDRIALRSVAMFLVCLAATATLLVIARWSDFIRNLPTIEQLLSPRSIMGFGLAFVLTRILHEIGHAVVCARLGARVSDTGLFFMMGIACPYVDVSDSQRLKKRWQRAAVAAAGVLVEVVVAAFAVIVWWLTREGPLHWFTFQIAVVCGISSLLFNANPLMRYDGYFVLSDIVDIPNLREKSASANRAFWSRCLFGTKSKESTNTSGWMIAFGFATSLYRSLLLLGIAFLIAQVCAAWRLNWLGILVISMLAISSILMPVCKAVCWSFREVRTGRLRPVRTFGAWLLLTVLICISLLLPIPQRMSFQGRVTTKNMQPIYAANSGILERRDESGVISLISHSLDQQLDLADARLQQSKFRAAVEQTVRAAQFDNQALEKIATAKSRLKWSNASVERRISEIRRSQLVSYQASSGEFVSSVVEPPPSPKSSPYTQLNGISSRKKTSSNTRHAIETWTDSTAVGRFVEEGTLVGWRITDDTKRVEITVDEVDLPWLHVGNNANVCFSQLPYSVFAGRVASVSFEPDANSIASGGAVYRAEIELLDSELPDLVIGGTASVVVKSENRPIADIARDWISRNFRLR